MKKSKFVGNGFINLTNRKPELIISIEDRIFLINIEEIVTPDKKVMCSVYEVLDPKEVSKDIKDFKQEVRNLSPKYEFTSKKNGYFGFVRGVEHVAFQFFDKIFIFESEAFFYRIAERASKYISKSKAYYSRLEHYLLTIINKGD